MSMLGQPYGCPVPTDGAGALTSALVRRLTHRGGTVRCGEQVTEVVVRNPEPSASAPWAAKR